MKNDQSKTVVTLLATVLSLGLAGCGGAKVLKEPEPLLGSEPLANVSDQGLAATLDWVIVRDSPGTWAKNADWDEYLLRVRNLGEESIIIDTVAVYDSLGTRIEPGADRKKLVKGAKEAKRRYKGQGLTVEAGAGAGTLLAAGAATVGATAAVVASAGIYSGTAATAATGGLILIPAFAVGGVFRGVNNSKVNKEIVSRQTALPIVLEGKEERTLDIFFPLTPSPRKLELSYADSRGHHTLVLDKIAALEGLHLVGEKQ